MSAVKEPYTSEPIKIVIEADSRASSLNLSELWSYRELLLFFVWRGIKVRYKQTVLGVSWAILQPFTTMVVFSIFFGGIAKIETSGIPYPVFSASGLVLWTFFASSLTSIATSITSNSHTIKKIYFPRITLPISQMLTLFVDFLLSFVVLLGMILFYQFSNISEVSVALSPNIIFIPFFILLAMTTTLGFGFWLAALNVQFRDVKYATGFIISLWLFITPIIYPTGLISPQWQIIYALNPMVGVIDGFRWALLGFGSPPNITLLLSVVVSIVLFMSGLWFFNRMEKNFADVV